MIFGTFMATPDNIAMAHELGFSRFDTSSGYQTESLLKDMYDEVYVQNKIWLDVMDDVGQYIDHLRQMYRCDALDNITIHTPRMPACDDWRHRLRDIATELVRYQDRGIIGSIGVSNFKIHHLKLISDIFRPAFNQVECHPGFPQSDIIDYCHNAGISIQAWGITCDGRVLKDRYVGLAARRHGCTPMQVIIGWLSYINAEPVVFTTRYDHAVEMLDHPDLDYIDMKMLKLCGNDRCGFDSDYNIEGIFD